MAVPGWFLAARTSRRVEARAVLSTTGGDHLGVLDAGGNALASAPLAQVAFGARVGSAPRRLTFPDGSVFETDSHDAVALLEGDTPASRLHGWEAFRPRLIGVVAVGVAGVWALWRYGLDIMVAGAVALTPAPLLGAMDAGTVQALDRLVADPSELSTEERARITGIFDDLVAALPPDSIRAGQDYSLGFRSIPMVGPNAFAMPGGSVIMTDAFVEAFPDSDMIAGVLGHEIGHVVDQHGLKQVYKSLSLYILVALMAGDTGPVLEDILLEGNLLLSLSFSREKELEADAFGVDLMREAGYDPMGLARVFAGLGAMSGGGSDWRSTHPASRERVQRIEDLIAAQGRP